MQDEESVETVNFIRKQFLQNVSVKEIRWETLLNIDWSLQEQILDGTTRSKVVLKYPINVKYQKTFLKSLIQHLEKQNSVIHDSVFEEYGRLVALPCDCREYFKHYFVGKSGKNIVLKEDIRLISEGTTGLRTWEASLALSEWILSNISIFKDKTILELGSGVGLTGLVIALHCSARNLYLSDCHSSVLQTLCDNININISKDKTESNKSEESCLLKKRVDSCTVSVLDLPWENISPEYCLKLGHIDMIVAADVVYDRSIFKPLVCAVNNLFKFCNVSQFILSCTERNTETLEDFLLLLNRQYQVNPVQVPAQENFLWSRKPPVKIFTLT